MRYTVGRFVWLAVALGGCFGGASTWPTGTGERSCGFLFNPRPCVPVGIAPETAHVLLGDTIRLASYSDDGSALPTWSVRGEALTILFGDEAVKELATPTNRVLVKAHAIGQSTIVAKSGAREAHGVLHVADSSVIATLTVNLCCSPYPDQTPAPSRIGASLHVSSALRDAVGTFYAARPVWSSPDSLAVTFEHSYMVLDNAFGPVTYARVHRAGTVRLIASFLALRDTLDITVVP